MVGGPPSPALPPQTAWGKGDASPASGALRPGGREYRLWKRDRILPSPRGTSGEGPGEGGPSGASSMQFVKLRTGWCEGHAPSARLGSHLPQKRLGEVGVGQPGVSFGRAGAGWWAAPHPRPFPHKQRGGRVTRAERAERFGTADTNTRLRKRDRILPFLPRSGGEGPGERGPVGRQFDAARRVWITTAGRVAALSGAGSNSPLSSRSLRGEGPGVGDPGGRSSMPVAARSNSPLSARNERGGGGGGAPPRRRSSMPFQGP
jgi:hypothetical protein